MDSSADWPGLLCVGSYSEPVSHSRTAHGRELQILHVDLSTGGQQVRFQSQGLVNPAFVAVHPTLPVVYAVSESWTAPGLVTSLRFTDDFARLAERRELPTGGQVPSYVSVVGDLLALSNYGDGSLATFRLDARGDLVDQTWFQPLTGGGPNPERQEGPHPHCVLPHPSNGLVYVADLGADLLMCMELDRTTGALTARQELFVPPGSGPRHLAFSGGSMFCVEELRSTLAVYALEPGGDLVLQQRLSMLPADVEGPSFGADLVVSPSGRRVYASNRGHDSVVTFSRPGSVWHATDWTATGAVPRGLCLTPDGRRLLVADQEADLIEVFDTTPGGLTPLVRLESATPSCLRWITPRR